MGLFASLFTNLLRSDCSRLKKMQCLTTQHGMKNCSSVPNLLLTKTPYFKVYGIIFNRVIG